MNGSDTDSHTGSSDDDRAQNRGTGKWMLWIFWLLVLAALVYVFGNIEDKRYNPNQSPVSTNGISQSVVSLKQNAFGHYVTTGSVNNQEVVFLLDTGATHVALPSQVAEDLGLQRGPRSLVYTANGIATAYATTIASLKIGDIELTDIRASITPGMTGDEILLGMSALRRVDFSQSGKTLTLTQNK